jgi:hypothetical protein
LESRASRSAVAPSEAAGAEETPDGRCVSEQPATPTTRMETAKIDFTPALYFALV